MLCRFSNKLVLLKIVYKYYNRFVFFSQFFRCFCEFLNGIASNSIMNFEFTAALQIRMFYCLPILIRKYLTFEQWSEVFNKKGR